MTERWQFCRILENKHNLAMEENVLEKWDAGWKIHSYKEPEGRLSLPGQPMPTRPANPGHFEQVRLWIEMGLNINIWSDWENFHSKEFGLYSNCKEKAVGELLEVEWYFFLTDQARCLTGDHYKVVIKEVKQ